MAGMKAKEVSERLTIRQFTRLCSTIDLTDNAGKKFNVVSIRDGEKERTLEILVVFDGGDLQKILVAA